MTKDKQEDRIPEVSRRSFIKGASLTLASVGIVGATAASAETTQEVAVVGPGAVELEFTLNGKGVKTRTAPSTTLLDLLRDQLDLTGSKRVCDRGSCGGCTAIVDGRTVNTCSMLAVDVAGKNVVSVEGVGEGEDLSLLQQAFVDCDALQCGFCTPGMVVACTSLLQRNPDPSRTEIREALAGNLCRCGTYQNIFEAVELAAKRKGVKRARF